MFCFWFVCQALFLFLEGIAPNRQGKIRPVTLLGACATPGHLSGAAPALLYVKHVFSVLKSVV